MQSISLLGADWQRDVISVGTSSFLDRVFTYIYDLYLICCRTVVNVDACVVAVLFISIPHIEANQLNVERALLKYKVREKT